MKGSPAIIDPSIPDELLHRVLDAVPDIIWLAPPNGVHAWLNRRGHHYTGLSIDEDLEFDIFSFAHPEDVSKIRHEWKGAVRTVSLFSGRCRLLQFDGLYRWHDVSALALRDARGKVQNWVGIASDVDNRVALETSLEILTQEYEETSALLDTILCDAPVGIAYLDRHFRVVRVNQELAAITRSSVAIRTNQLVEDALPMAWSQIQPIFQHVLKSGQPVLDFEVTVPSTDDPSLLHHWMANFYPVRLRDEIIGIGVIVIDITAQLESEKQRLLLATIVDGSGDAIYGTSLEGIVTSWNCAAEILFGYSTEEAVGQSMMFCVPPDLIDESRATQSRVISTRQAEHLNTFRRTKDGLDLDVQVTVSPLLDAAGTVIGVSRIAHDVTERRRAERSLIESQRQLIDTQRIAHLGGVQYDIADETMTWTDETYRILDIDGDVTPSPNLIISHTHPDDVARVREAWFGAALHGVAFEIDFRIIRGDLQQRDVNARAEVEFSDEHVPIRVTGTLSDETRRVEAEKIARDTELRFEIGFQQSGVGTVLSDLNGFPLRINQAVCDLMARPEEQLLGRAWTEFTHPDDVPLWQILQTSAQEGKAGFTGRRRYLRPDGSIVWADVHVSIVRDEQGVPLYYFCHLFDVTEYRRMSEELAHMAMHDALTGLPNRALLADRMAQSLARSQRGNSRVSVMFLDIDNFKEVNDAFGHSCGDELLTNVAGKIKKAVRPGDTVARFGSDEFVVVCDAATDSEIKVIANRMLEAIEEPVAVGDKHVHLSASIGIAVSDSQSTPETMLQNAEFAMYRAKNAGAASLAMYDEELHDKVERNLATTAALRKAIDNHEFKAYYQPVVDLDSGGLISVEALLRWEHPSGMLVNPDEFIPLAEHSGLIIPMGAWMLREACQQLASWRELQPDLTIAVNISVRQLLHQDILATVRDTLSRARIPAASLSLELTESLLMEDVNYCVKVLTELKNVGVRLVVDDFGTGYSSLSYLSLFPFDEVKIDRAFVNGLGKNEHDSALVAAIIAMSEALALNVTAEGIETREQMTLLKGLHCREAQGYYFARPMRAAELTEFIREHYRWSVA